ncbi:MAG: hypothetical protein IJ105_02510 [Bacilli bacterium]|nr:hypothetical protein [Bacilli bacterium]
MKNIIVINGYGGSGKDTFVELVSKYNKVYNFSSVDKVKEIARLIGWNGQKEEKDRKFLSDLKKLTTDYNDMSFNSIKDAINDFNSSDKEIMFIHVREPEEIKRIVDKYHAKTLFIKRDDIKKVTSNYSDASVENYNYDFIINNTTLEDLDKQASNFYTLINK